MAERGGLQKSCSSRIFLGFFRLLPLLVVVSHLFSTFPPSRALASLSASCLHKTSHVGLTVHRVCDAGPGREEEQRPQAANRACVERVSDRPALLCLVKHCFDRRRGARDGRTRTVADAGRGRCYVGLSCLPHSGIDLEHAMIMMSKCSTQPSLFPTIINKTIHNTYKRKSHTLLNSSHLSNL